VNHHPELHSPAAAAADFVNEAEHPPARAGFLAPVFAVLLAFTAAALLIGFADLGEYRALKVILQLGVAGTQAAVLALFFMDLRKADRVTALAVGAALFWTGILFVIMLTDYVTRHLGAI